MPRQARLDLPGTLHYVLMREWKDAGSSMIGSTAVASRLIRGGIEARAWRPGDKRWTNTGDGDFVQRMLGESKKNRIIILRPRPSAEDSGADRQDMWGRKDQPEGTAIRQPTASVFKG